LEFGSRDTVGMTTDFDINAFAAHLVSNNLDRLSELIASLPGKASLTLKSLLRKTYSEYLKRAGEKYGRAKTFFVRDAPRPLYEYFVPLDLKTGSSVIHSASIADIEKRTRTACILGNAGSGKSVLMRHLFLDTLRIGKRVPVFFELRELNNDQDVPLIRAIVEAMKRLGMNVDDKHIEASILGGRFAIFLDGLDEVDYVRKQNVIEQIVTLAEMCKDGIVIVSSRHDSETSALLGDFSEFVVQPLPLDASIELVAKLPFDEATKNSFVVDLRKSLYRKHTSFLSNPLLLSIMLLTYGQSASIPDRVTVFYNQAYEALFQTHDAYKGSFVRKRKTSLDIRDFEFIFSTFCLFTYDSFQFSFTPTTAIERLEQSRQVTGLSFETRDFLDDLLHSVNLLVPDGLTITFVHRSFQEYFAARFVCRTDTQKKEELFARFAARPLGESGLGLCVELDPAAVEERWLFPIIEALAKKIRYRSKITLAAYARLFSEFYDAVTTSNPDGLSYHHARGSRAIHHAKWIVHGRYWITTRRAVATQPSPPKNALRNAIAELPNRTLRTKNLKAKDNVTQLLARDGGFLSLEFAEFFLSLPELIRNERNQQGLALERILGIG
jgi:hypothetical protein